MLQGRAPLDVQLPTWEIRWDLAGEQETRAPLEGSELTHVLPYPYLILTYLILTYLILTHHSALCSGLLPLTFLFIQ